MASEPLAGEIIPLNNRAPSVADVPAPVKRVLADLLKKAGQGELLVEAMGKKMRYDHYLALMLWDAVTTGEFYFADGRHLQIQETKEWLEIVKFLMVHIDGPAVQDNTFNGINVFKVYQGIDTDRV